MIRKMLRRGAAAVLFLGLLLGGAARAEEDEIMLQISRMTLRQKVGQLFMVRPDVLEKRFGPAELEDNSIIGTTRVSDEMRDLYREYPCGGFALFRKNILSPSQLRMYT